MHLNERGKLDGPSGALLIPVVDGPVRAKNRLLTYRRTRLAMRVTPLPIVSSFPLAGMGPFVVLNFMLFQITMPRFVFAIIPVVLRCIVMLLCRTQGHSRWRQQTQTQNRQSQ
jgi:hypothetical protein